MRAAILSDGIFWRTAFPLTLFLFLCTSKHHHLDQVHTLFLSLAIDSILHLFLSADGNALLTQHSCYLVIPRNQGDKFLDPGVTAPVTETSYNDLIIKL